MIYTNKTYTKMIGIYSQIILENGKQIGRLVLKYDPIFYLFPIVSHYFSSATSTADRS